MCEAFSAYLAFQLLAGSWVLGVLIVFSPLQQKNISVQWQCLYTPVHMGYELQSVFSSLLHGDPPVCVMGYLL